MTDELFYGAQHQKPNWGCSFSEVKGDTISSNVFVCHVNVSDIKKIADELSKSVMDDSWIMDLDDGSKRAYKDTVAETADALVDIFKNQLLTDNKVSGEFGEIMVSMGSAQALEVIFSHIPVPIAELWKPQVKGNEGFDFHTVCQNNVINFGEAKFSGSKNPYAGISGESSGASGQADGFFNKKKHLRDRVHLVNLVEKDAIANLDKNEFGAVVAFSINAKNPLTVFKNAISSVINYPDLAEAKNIYVVGVTHDS